MKRFGLAAAVLGLLTGASAMGSVVAGQKNPVTVSFNVTSDVDISNGVLLYSQSGTPQGLNQFISNTYTVPHGVPTNVSSSLNGQDPFGFYTTFTSMNAMFLGTYSGQDNQGNPTTGVVATLPTGSGTGSFSATFSGADEATIVNALMEVGAGAVASQSNYNDGISKLFTFQANTLADQPSFGTPNPTNTYPTAGDVVKFSTGFTGGTFTASIVITPTSVTATPEPSTLVAAGIAGLMGLGAFLRRNRAA